MWCITLRTLMAKQPPLCPSQSLAIMVQACTSINRYGKTGATSSQEKATRACRVRAPLYRRHYPARSALLMAGLDGVQNNIHPGEAADKNLYALSPEEDRKMATVCSSLEQALDCLDQDRE